MKSLPTSFIKVNGQPSLIPQKYQQIINMASDIYHKIKFTNRSIMKWSSCALLCILLLSIGLSSTYAQGSKKKRKPAKKSSVTANTYQDMTSRYNRYFNAKLRFREGIDQLQNAHSDNFDQLLPLFVYEGGKGSTIANNLDQVIAKTSTVVQLRPNSKWVDDCYLLLGQAYYLKGETESAVQAFQYVTNRFSKDIRKSYDRRSREKQKQISKREKELEQKEREREREKEEKERAEARKKEEKEREDAKKVREDEKKEREKERAQVKKEREKEKAQAEKERAQERKVKEKERAQEKKAREKEKARIQKLKAKEKKRRLKAKKKGKKYVPSAAWLAYKEDLKQRKEEKEAAALEKEEEQEEVVEEKEKKAEKEEKKKKNDKVKDNKEEELQAEEEEETEEAEEERSVDEILADEFGSIVDETEGDEGNRTYKTSGPLSLFSHKPVKYDAMIWLLHTYIDNGKFAEASSVIETTQNDPNFPKRLSGQLNQLTAHYYLKRQENGLAKEALTTAIDNTRKKKDKARMHYILAQLQLDENEQNEAIKSFTKVLKAKPSYLMEFNANLNIAKTKFRSGSFSAERALAYLEKMKKDGKNVDNKDQILFAMSEVAMESGDEALAAEYLEEAASFGGSTNPDQRARSFLRLAELNYDKRKYVPSSAYYDSTATVLPKTFTDYEAIMNKQKVMQKLSRHLRTYELQDSLQRIAKMPEANRNAYIDEIIAELEKEAKAQREAELERELKEIEAKNNNNNNNRNNNKNSGTWYFYNPAAKGVGFSDFRSKWGNRPASDNWRLSSKASQQNNVFAFDTTGTSQEELAEMAAKGMLTRESIINQLPLTTEAMTISNGLIVEALYFVGKIFREDLDKNEEAQSTFKRLLKRFPANAMEPETLYNLYLIADQNNSAADKKQYKTSLLQKYPDSKYAKYLLDENFLNKYNSAQQELANYYQETYDLYKSGNFDSVKDRLAKVDTLPKDNPLKAKFDLIDAFLIGEVDKDKKAYIAALEKLLITYPNHEITPKVEEILLFINSEENVKIANNAPKGKANYKASANVKHYLLVTFDGASKNIKKFTFNMSDFNKVNFSVDKLKVNQMMLDPKNQIVMVKDFPNGEAAMRYYKTLQANEVNVFKPLEVSFQYFVISKVNFSEYFKRKNAEEYLKFFYEQY